MALSRRSFLKFSLSANGALIVGLPSLTEAAENNTTSASLNPYFEFHQNNQLHVQLPQVEMGQGIDVALGAMVAEELDLLPSQVIVRSPSYTSATPRDFRANRTGGSQSIRRQWPNIRQAAAEMRARFVKAASNVSGVAETLLVTRAGTVVSSEGKYQARYADLIPTVLTLSKAPFEFKAPQAYRYLGKSYPDASVHDKVTGQQTYVIDKTLPNQRVAVVLRGPLSAEPKSVDAKSALASEGVLDVVQMPNGVAVLAKTYWQAVVARDKLRVEWDQGPFSHLSNADIDDVYNKAYQEEGQVIYQQGQAKGSPSDQIEVTFKVPFLAHVPMETMNCLAEVTTDRCVVWAPTQDLGYARSVAAKVSGFPESLVDVHVLPLGGGFGRRLHQDYVAEAVFLAMRTQGPVKLIWPREDDIQSGFYRPRVDVHIKAGVSQSGELSSISESIVGPGELDGPLPQGFVSSDSVVNQIKGLFRNLKHEYMPDQSAGALVYGLEASHYALPARQVKHHYCDVGVPLAYWRSVSHYHNNFALESLLDMAAQRGNQDPIQYRIELAAKDARAVHVLETLQEKSGWHHLEAYKGVSLFVGYGSVSALVIEVSKVQGELNITKMVCVADCGQAVNPDRVRAQIEGGLLFGLSSVLGERIEYKNGRVQQSNFHNYPMLNMSQSPQIDITLITSQENPGGVGELAVPLVAPAVCNALATLGKRPTSLPVTLVGAV